MWVQVTFDSYPNALKTANMLSYSIGEIASKPCDHVLEGLRTVVYIRCKPGLLRDCNRGLLSMFTQQLSASSITEARSIYWQFGFDSIDKRAAICSYTFSPGQDTYRGFNNARYCRRNYTDV